MASVYHRNDSPFLWGKWTDAAGEEQRGSLETADEAEARARVEELERLARGADAPAAAAGGLTVEGFVGTSEAPGEWLKLRKVSKPLAWRDDLSRLKHHFFPAFGARPLAWLATDDGGRALYSWAIGLKTHTAKRSGEAIGSRSVWNTFYAAKVLLDDAAEWKRLARNPLESFKADRHLPAKTDKKDGWRETAGFELEQVVNLTTNVRLEARRRVWNALAFMAGGARTGELANLRWRDWTETYKGGLGRLVISSAYNTRAKVEKATKTGAKKLIPVHPFVGALLAAWRDEGWKAWMGREPTPSDFIVPQSDGKQQRNWRLLADFHADLDLLGIPRQRQYENRSTFRNLLFQRGAPEFAVNLMTHPSPKQASDFYTRLEMQWPTMCEAILRLEHAAWKVTPQGTDVPAATVSPAKEDENPIESQVFMLEPTAGVEPATYGLRNQPKTGQNGAEQAPDDSASGPTIPPLRLIACGTAQDGALPPMTGELFTSGAAIAALCAPDQGSRLLRRGLEQAAALAVE